MVKMMNLTHLNSEIIRLNGVNEVWSLVTHDLSIIWFGPVIECKKPSLSRNILNCPILAK